jgi:hypothetical protein
VTIIYKTIAGTLDPEFETSEAQDRFKNMTIDQAWAHVWTILQAPEFRGMLRQVPFSFFSPTCVSGDVSMIVPHPHDGAIELTFMTLDLSKFNGCDLTHPKVNECREYLKWMIAYLQKETGLITSGKSIDQILDSYIETGVMAFVVGEKGHSVPLGVSIGSVESDGGIRYKGQYLSPKLQGNRVSALMDQVVLKYLINNYKLTFPLRLTARSSTLAVLAKMPGFLADLENLAYFMNSINDFYDPRENDLYQALHVLMVECDSGIPEIRELLMYINRFGVGENWAFDIQIQLYQLMVEVLSATYDSEEAFKLAVEALQNQVFDDYGTHLNVTYLTGFYNAVQNSRVVMSPFRLLALSCAIVTHAPASKKSFDFDDVKAILANYHQLLNPRNIHLSDRTNVNVHQLDIEKVSTFFARLQEPYHKFRLAGMDVRFGFDLLVLFASSEQDYRRVGQWNRQLSLQQCLPFLSQMKKSVLSEFLAKGLPSTPGELTEGLFSQLLLSGIQTGAYFLHHVEIDGPIILNEYFKSKQPSEDFLRQSEAYCLMKSALVMILTHVLVLSDANRLTEIKTDATQNFRKLFLRTMDAHSLNQENCLSACLPSHSLLPFPPNGRQSPNDLHLKRFEVDGQPVVVSRNSEWVSGWDAPFHALYGVDSSTGNPMNTNSEFEICQCIESVLKLLIDNEKNQFSEEIRSKIHELQPYIDHAKNFLFQANILKQNQGFSECNDIKDERFIDIYFNIKKLKLKPGDVASLYILHKVVKNKPIKGLCIVEGNACRVFSPPGKTFDPSNAVYIEYDPNTGNYARLNHRSIQPESFVASFQSLSQCPPMGDVQTTDSIASLLNRMSQLERMPQTHWHSFAEDSVQFALKIYFQHNNADEFKDKLKRLFEDLSRFSRCLEDPRFVLNDLLLFEGDGSIRSILDLAFLKYK